MPELPEVETVRRGLEPVMQGARFKTVEARRRGYPFPILVDRGALLADAVGADYATYSVVVQTYDNSGINADFSDANVSSSTPIEGTPVAALDFLQIYADDGGSGQGCATGGVPLLAMIGLGISLAATGRKD